MLGRVQQQRFLALWIDQLCFGKKMHLSPYALQLLRDGKFERLLSLSYTEMLSEEPRLELINAFLLHSFLNKAQALFRDPFSWANISNACVISSGHILSQSSVDDMLMYAGGKNIKCLFTNTVITTNIGHSSCAYVLLPCIDRIIFCFEALCAIGQVMSAQEIEAAEREPIAITEVIDGTLTLMTSKERIKIIIEFCTSDLNDYQNLVAFLRLMLPAGEIKPEWDSYYMHRHQFGRSWMEDNHGTLMLNFWFPAPSSVEKTQRTFSTSHLKQAIHILLSVLSWPVIVNDNPLPREFSLSHIDEHMYVMLIDKTPASFRKILACVHRFLVFTTKTATQLGLQINDTAHEGRSFPTPSCIVSTGYFSPQRAAKELSIKSESLTST